MTALDIQATFPGELDAIIYFEKLRWGGTTRCAYCNTSKVSKRQQDNRFHCSQCRKTFSVTTGTYLHSSKLPVKIWMRAFSIMGEGTSKISIKQLQHGLGVSYTTAWRIRQELKEMMGNDFGQAVKGNIFDALCRKAISQYTQPVELERATV